MTRMEGIKGWNNMRVASGRNLKRTDQSGILVFGVNTIPHFTFMLPKTRDIAFSLPRAAVQGDLLKYKNKGSTLHGVIIIQPTSGLLVEGEAVIVDWLK
ncbi:hypothetical protein M3O96_05845 [Aquiflexum sp. TKW24L]|uniref:hypothetical protein n=1 Tax=Aquiflexum sp. TKW24L TaxID=2942212 RepID=UPI0020BE1CC1|nr:hypothetical protein [Aquiflexum sp. TKW24L]MCL6258601.1 hypothetical protein [Aquiflexum sp. TKW24L]